jgi:prevent-host-death family protein
MKKVAIQDLKASLSALVSEAEAGATILITRHNAPVAELGPSRISHVHRGAQVGKGRLSPVLKRGTRGRYLQVLLEDRSER